ncbi:Hypothetical predicted protein, partial [Lynx pardinus]
MSRVRPGWIPQWSTRVIREMGCLSEPPQVRPRPRSLSRGSPRSHQCRGVGLTSHLPDTVDEVGTQDAAGVPSRHHISPTEIHLVAGTGAALARPELRGLGSGKEGAVRGVSRNRTSPEGAAAA